jgi:hypothetical protein
MKPARREKEIKYLQGPDGPTPKGRGRLDARR